MIQIEIIAATSNPVDVISKAAGTCYGQDNVIVKRVRNCYKYGHMSVFEHASVTFKIRGISRACSHQLVRHRLASYSQESQRYCEINTDSDWYVTPDSFENSYEYDEYMRVAAEEYKDALAAGIKPEDARYLLPEACKTKIVVTMNCRELFHFLDLRQDKSAQWEIRNLANELENALSWLHGWSELMRIRKDESHSA